MVVATVSGRRRTDMNELDLNGCLYVLSMIPVAHHSRLTANSTRHHHIMAFGDKKLVSPTHVRQCPGIVTLAARSNAPTLYTNGLDKTPICHQYWCLQHPYLRPLGPHRCVTELSVVVFIIHSSHHIFLSQYHNGIDL